uniref:Uncharacterized protein n=1 Tax=Schistocephalus solidus TaxID=70667 RepID=A0A0V0J6V7_SCHSO
MRSRNPSTPLRSQGYRNRNSSPASFNFTFSSPSPEFHSPPFGPQGNYLSPPDRQPVGHWQQWPPFVPSPERIYLPFQPSWNVSSPLTTASFDPYGPNRGTSPRGQFNSPSQSSPVICYPPPFKSPMTNFPHTPSSNRTFYMSAVADTPSTCASLSGQSNLSDSSRTHVTKVLNWKQRCTTDPWIGILPQATPSSGDRLVTSAFNQRHTVLFAPHSQISHEPIVQSS